MAYIENYYIDKYGVQFSKDKKTLIAVPEDYKGIYEIPFGTITVEPDAFFNCKHITAIIIPSTVEDIFEPFAGAGSEYFVDSCSNLAYFFVDSKNKNYYTIEGVLCEKERDGGNDMVIAYPPAKKSTFILPPNLSIIGALWNSLCILEHLKIENSHSLYAMKDGAIYNKELSTLIQAPINQRRYIMPDSIEKFELGAFSGCKKLTSIQLGQSFVGCVNGDGVFYSDFIDCTSLRTIKVHPDNKKYHTENGYLFEGYGYGIGYTHEELIFCPQAYKPKTFWIPDTEKISEGAFTNCRYFNTPVLNCHNSIPLYIGANAFDGTPFYSNQENWKDGILIGAAILIKVSEEYKQNKLVIPRGVPGITVDNSINNEHITEIEIEDGYSFFNSRALNCPNLRTIKFPKILANSCLHGSIISLLEHCPKLEKILIPQGTRDFFLRYSNPNLHELMIEYDLDNNEIGKIHMTE